VAEPDACERCVRHLYSFEGFSTRAFLGSFFAIQLFFAPIVALFGRVSPFAIRVLAR
jgi:hypothetical protein